MKDAALETLFYTFAQNPRLRPTAGDRVLFLHARYHADLRGLEAAELVLQQGFKPDADALEAGGYRCVQDIAWEESEFDSVFILLPKNHVQARGLMARGLACLRDDGVFVCSAENKAGGSRIQKDLQHFGCFDFSAVSKHKARCVWLHKGDCDWDAIQHAITAGAVRDVLNDAPDGPYSSQPGIFGWDKIDQGSAILTEYLPHDLKGKGADFGCGYGYLSRYVLTHCKDVQMLNCLDADIRAVAACERNVGSGHAQFLWADLTKHGAVSGLDFIVMNPPFHAGAKMDRDIGAAFIENAAKALQPGGALWMVANGQLPYEAVLAQNFKQVHCVFQGRGFKVFHAIVTPV